MSWKTEKAIIVGDSRAERIANCTSYIPTEYLEVHSRSGASMTQILKFTEQRMEQNMENEEQLITLVILIGLHCDFTKMETLESTRHKIMVPDIDLDIEQYVLTLGKKLVKLNRSFPFARFLVTIPYMPHFDRYNTRILKTTLGKERLNKLYPYERSCHYSRQFAGIVDQFYDKWDKYLEPRPLALARIERYLLRNSNKYKNKTYRRDKLKPFTGPTEDGLHMFGSSLKFLWRILFLHDKIMKKHYKTGYQWNRRHKNMIMMDLSLDEKQEVANLNKHQMRKTPQFKTKVIQKTDDKGHSRVQRRIMECRQLERIEEE